MKVSNYLKVFAIALPLMFFLSADKISAQSFMTDVRRDSARSDKRTGGEIKKTTLVAGDGDIKITLNVPAFQMTLWQNGKEVKSYPVGVGMKEYPIYIGFREATEVIWNPDWIPPASDWVEGSTKVKAGEIIPATDKRNPLGKVKIPLGLGYLIHQAHGAEDLGNLVSHGCVRVMQPDLYDLAEKIVAARNPAVSPEQISNAKRTKNTVIAELDTPIPVEITYDTQVVEAGKLHIYPDVYGYRKNTVVNLRAELESEGVNSSKITDETLEKMLAQATEKKQFVVSLKSILAGRALDDGRAVSVLTQTIEPSGKTPTPARRKIARNK